MRRRDIAPALIASVSGAAFASAPATVDPRSRGGPSVAEAAAKVRPSNMDYADGPMRYGAKGDGTTDDTPAWREMGRVGGFHFVPDGVYAINGKVQTSSFVSIVGATRQNTVLRGAAFSDYVLEIGDRPNGPNPNVGSLHRLRFMGSAGNRGLLHMNRKSHMWRLDELLFQSSPCPALIIDDCWDSNYTNIDVLGCGAAHGSDPATGAMLIVNNESNNIYLRGIRLEHGPVGALYVGKDCSPIYVITGKIDQGFIPQHAAAVTVATGAALVMDDFNITGVDQQYTFDVAGSLLLGNVSIYGGTGRPAIHDARSWRHLDGLTIPGGAGASFGPYIPRIHLGTAQFSRGSFSIDQNMNSVIHSKISPMRLIARLHVSGNGHVSQNSILVQTDLPGAANNLYDNCYLVHNSTGNQTGRLPGARRKILTSFVDGQLLLQGDWACTLDSDWSIEFCGGHFTPRLAVDSIQIDQGMSLFTEIASNLRIADAPVYRTAASSLAPGATIFGIRVDGVFDAEDLAGYFLIDDATGEPFYICQGSAASRQIAVPYDCTGALNGNHTYTVVAGYSANVKQNGSAFEWTFAGRRKSVRVSVAESLGFDIDNLPLWGFDMVDGPIRLAASASVLIDAALGRHVVLTASDSKPFSIAAMGNPAAGDRVLLTVRNAGIGAMGAIDWHPTFRLGPWTNPAPGANRSIEFCADGVALTEVGRTPFDVPNG